MAVARLLAEMLSAPFFNNLRTEKQLGYVVTAFANPIELVPGLVMLVQSPVADEDSLRQEFATFIAAFANEVEKLSELDLQRYKGSLLNSLTEEPKNLSELNGRFMESLQLGYIDFDYREQLVEAISRVSIGDLQSGYRQIVVESSGSLWVITAANDNKDTTRDLRVNGPTYQYDF